MTCPADRDLVAEWERSLVEGGWSPASARRAANRLREFAGATRSGLLLASRQDVLALADRRVKATGLSVKALIRTESWRQTVRTIKLFYRWVGKNYPDPPRDPTTGIFRPPSCQPGVRIKPADARLYEAILAVAGISHRDRAVLRLLALGMLTQEVASLRVESVNLGLREVEVGLGGSRRVPLSDRAAAALSIWLSDRPGHSAYVFTSPDGTSPISTSTVRRIVRKAASVAFPRPDQEHLRRRVHATGFRELFIVRSIRAGVPVGCVRSLTGLDRLTRLESYVRSPEPQALHRQLATMAKRWRGWI